MTCTKRSADLDQPVDTFAVCTTCNRLSCDLRTCDKCGRSLADESTAHCYSSDPKRSCAEPPTNSSVTSASNGLTTSTEGLRSVKPAFSSGLVDSAVRPQALYVNVNNQIFPVIGVGTASSSSGTLTLSRSLLVGSSNICTATSGSLNGTVAPIQSVGNSSSRSLSASSRQYVCSVASNNATVYPNRLETSAPMSHINLPSYNLQPPLPPFAASVARLPGIVSGTVQAAVVPAPSVATVVSSSQNVQVNAVQIRIGSRKFKPSTPVTFKDDGILFTLKDYTYAPVLLNARAIVKCKANLSTFSYPVLFLFLENSCMRQIRNIFGLTANEFSYNSPVEMKRCISIFPVFGVEGKSQAQSVMYTIKRSFEAMVRRYPRSSSILEDISNDQSIDILLEGSINDSSARSESSSGELVSVDNLSTMTSGSSALSSSRSDPSSCSSGLVLGNEIQPQSITANGLATTSCDLNNQSSVTTVSAARVTAQLNRLQSTAPILQIPSDQARWHVMQKALVANGVYHVEMPNGHRQYCLWNGKQLVPCFVQNTEVQLSCMRVRIGSLLAQNVGQVRVKADQSSGIHFTVKSDHSGTQEIAISPEDIETCEVCFSNIAVLFLVLNKTGAEKIRKKLKLHVNVDPAFDPDGPVHLQHILLFLNSVNRDQEEALMQMKFNRAGINKSLVETMEISQAIKLLAQIKLSTRNEAAVAEFLSSRHMTGVLGFEKLVNDVSSSAAIASSDAVDDDDDVIMTQEEVGVKCPYTQQVMKNPVRNIICGHNYERLAIQEFILRKKGNAKCPYAGCANLVPLRMEDLVENAHLREYITKHVPSTQL